MENPALCLTATDHYRRLVALLYREIGVLKPKNHALANKAKKDRLFARDTRKERAKFIYDQTLGKTDPAQIAAEYHKRSGLTLQEVHEALVNGKWQDPSGGYLFGGPRWALIAEHTIKLGDALQQEAWNDIPPLIAVIRTLRHNTGLITGKYAQLG